MEARTLWRGQRDTTRRAFWVLLALSLVLHLPLTPLAQLVGLWRALTDTGEPADSVEMTGIPVDLIEQEEGPSTPPPPAEPPPAEPAVAPEQPKEKDPEAPKAERDAGAPDAGAGDAGPEDAGPAADAGPSDAGLSDPVALKGAVRDLSDKNVNVQLRVYTSRIRKLPLGARVGRLLGAVPQWRDFFGPANIDPIQDVDQILILGPQLRDSSQVLAALKLAVPEERIRLALDHLVQADREGGHWVEDAGIPIAVARADRAPRVFAMPGSGVVVVVPPQLQDKVARAGKALIKELRATGGAEVLSATVKDPANALRGVFRAPKSIKVARVHVVPTPDGGAEILIEAEDSSPEQAAESATYLQDTVSALTTRSLPLLGDVQFVKSVTFDATGSTINGRIVVTQAQILDILDFVGMIIGQPASPRSPTSAPPP